MDSKDLKKLQAYILIALIVSVLSLLSSIVKNIVNERWAKSRNQVACVPSDVTGSYPLTYHQTAAHPVYSDAMIKSFVEEYIRLTKNDQIVNYHKTTDDGRYQNAMLSESRFKAISMALPDSPESSLVKMKYAQSYDTYQILKKGSVGWVFLIDSMVVLPTAGGTLAIVTGEYQMTYDNVEVPMPAELWGYREIHFHITAGEPLLDQKGNYLNKYGLFVRWSYEQILSGEQKQALDSRGFDYYMKGNNE